MASPSEASPPQEIASISAVVAMIRVETIARSAAFYRLLGFEIGNYVLRVGPMHWAWLYSVKADDWKRGPNLMLTRCSRAIDPAAQEVLFYLYAKDLKSVRDVLLANGVAAGDICYPEYLPDGEFKVSDPDGYTLMIAQGGADTP